MEIAFISVLAFDIIHGTHNISYNWLFVIVPVTFVVLSFCVMHLGLNNATDCLWTLVLVSFTYIDPCVDCNHEISPE